MWQRSFAGVCMGLSWLLLAATACAAEGELTRLLPADVAACLEIQRLDERWLAWQKHPLKLRWTGSPLWPLFQQSRPWQRWQAMEAVVAAHTGRKLSEHIRDAASSSLVLSLRISPEGQPQALVLAKSLRRGAAEELVAAWKRMEPARTFEDVETDGLKYLRSSRGDDAIYLLVADDVIGMSDQEVLIQDALRRLNGEADTESLSQAGWWRSVKELTSADTVAILGINARAWDPLLAAAAQNDPEAVHLAAIWKAVERVRVEISLTHSLLWNVQADLVEAQLPAAWVALLQGAHRRTPPNYKSNAWLVIQGGFDLKPGLDLLVDAFAAGERAEWRKMERVASGLGSGLVLGRDLLAPLAEDYFLIVDGVEESEMPFQALLQMRWDDARPRELPQVYERLLSIGLALLTVESNLKSSDGTALVIRQDLASENGPSRRWLEPGFFAWRPGFQVWPQALILFSDPAAKVLEEMPQPMAAEKSQPPRGGAAVAVQLNLRGFREHVRRNSGKWLALMSRGDPDREPEIVAAWQRAEPVLALADLCWIALRGSPEEVSLNGGFTADASAQ